MAAGAGPASLRSSSLFLLHRNQHVREKLLAREEGVKIFQRFGDERSVRALYGGKPWTTGLIGKNERVAHQRATTAEYSPQIGAEIGLIADDVGLQPISLGDLGDI